LRAFRPAWSILASGLEWGGTLPRPLPGGAGTATSLQVTNLAYFVAFVKRNDRRWLKVGTGVARPAPAREPNSADGHPDARNAPRLGIKAALAGPADARLAPPGGSGGVFFELLLPLALGLKPLFPRRNPFDQSDWRGTPQIVCDASVSGCRLLATGVAADGGRAHVGGGVRRRSSGDDGSHQC